ncbi:hypothetical protein BO71DRAFT_372767 [Aspergillus ellipticus CBS 707.79]|uniref:Uncharacterized protein n=1 Tax=Aspergillus ellipticus CBS 707.79 TaxID=1448320 RepID=A0A319DJI1_9EURO|nr:hypothetical protein BO71DRAFT_372767 [Aspergillus ellipticus CBS 707.79]
MSTDSWFPSSLALSGAKITLREKEWMVLEKVSEYDFLKDKEDVRDGSEPSFSCVRLRCRSRTSPVPAFMRIYMQIPLAGTKSEPPADRARQACKFTPEELWALKTMTERGSRNTPRLLDYKESTQDSSGPVPGGFITWIVWEIIPGICLGDTFGADRFWQLKQGERRAIQEAFPDAYKKLLSKGFYPAFGGPKNLVWQPETKHLLNVTKTKLTNYSFFVGFRRCRQAKPPYGKWSPSLFAVYALAKPPDWCEWYETTWDGNMKDWECIPQCAKTRYYLVLVHQYKIYLVTTFRSSPCSTNLLPRRSDAPFPNNAACRWVQSTQVDARHLVREALPDLRRGHSATKNSAIHDITFPGKLERWDNFSLEAHRAYTGHNWKGTVLNLQHQSLETPHSLSIEQVVVGDETGVQGRFNEHIGQDMGGVFSSQEIPLRFGDFKSSSKVYKKIPDSVICDAAGNPMVVGELKVPWVREHNLSALIRNKENFREAIGEQYILKL